MRQPTKPLGKLYYFEIRSYNSARIYRRRRIVELINTLTCVYTEHQTPYNTNGYIQRHIPIRCPESINSHIQNTIKSRKRPEQPSLLSTGGRVRRSVRRPTEPAKTGLCMRNMISIQESIVSGNQPDRVRLNHGARGGYKRTTYICSSAPARPASPGCCCRGPGQRRGCCSWR